MRCHLCKASRKDSPNGSLYLVLCTVGFHSGSWYLRLWVKVCKCEDAALNERAVADITQSIISLQEYSGFCCWWLTCTDGKNRMKSSSSRKKDFKRFLDWTANSNVGPKCPQTHKSLASFPCIVLCNRKVRIKQQESLGIYFFFASARSSVQIAGKDDDNCRRPSQRGHY